MTVGSRARYLEPRWACVESVWDVHAAGGGVAMLFATAALYLGAVLVGAVLRQTPRLRQRFEPTGPEAERSARHCGGSRKSRCP